ncbi:MAG: hypothetical protein A2X45_14650 [Lentisphaerae bacterium GWF2_50_93]|nr:MAG: hypothetical protein A2X45_14650 [Lentisphaerae bacterium GWF2_50_93]
MKKAVIYARTSSDDKDESGKRSVSITSQVKECRALAEKHGLSVIHPPFVDQDLSGRTYPDLEDARLLSNSDDSFNSYFSEVIKFQRKKYRPELGACLACSDIEFIIVYDETRLMRPYQNSFLGQYLIQRLKKSSIQVLTVKNGIIDYGKFSDRLVSTISQQVEDDIIIKTRQKSKESLNVKRNTGFLTSGVCCYGYRSTGHQTVEQVEEEAKNVKLIFKMYAREKKSINQIAKHLNSKQIGTKKGHTWHHNAILKVLKREAYAGLRRNIEGKLIECIPFKGKEIISAKEFHSALHRLRTNRNAGKTRIKDSDVIHPLSGLVYCGTCGRRMKVSKAKSFEGKAAYYYVCYDHIHLKSTDNKACRMARILERSANPLPSSPKLLAHKGLVEFALPLCAKALIEALSGEDKVDEAEAKLLEKENERSRINENLVKLGMLLKDGKYTPEAFEEVSKGFMVDIKKSEEEIGILKEKIQKSKVPYESDEIVKILGDIMHNRVDANIYRDVVLASLEKIEIHPYSIKVTFKDKSSFSVERIPERNSRMIPDFGMHIDMSNQDISSIRYIYKSIASDIGKGEISISEIDRKYKKNRIYTSPHLKIYSYGINPKPHEYALKVRHRKPNRNYQEMLAANIVAGDKK